VDGSGVSVGSAPDRIRSRSRASTCSPGGCRRSSRSCRTGPV